MTLANFKTRIFNLSRKHKGYGAETLALKFLEQHGLNLLHRNYITQGSEIDLIMKDNAYIVFVEVRMRRNQRHYGSAIESVTLAKQRRIIQGAKLFLQQKNWTHRYPCRFDVIGLNSLDPNDTIHWIKNAFSS